MIDLVEQMYPGDGFALLALNITVQVCGVVLLAKVMSLCVRRNAAARHAIWLCALACVTISPLLAWAMHHVDLPVLRWSPLTRTLQPVDAPQPHRAVTDSPAMVQDVPSLHAVQSGIEEHAPPAEALPQPNPEPLPPQRVHAIISCLMLVWLAGATLLMGRLLVGLWCLRSLGKTLIPMPDAVAHAMSLMPQPPRGMHAPMVASSDRISGPISIGLLRPIIVLPAALLGQLDAEKSSAVLAHELAHIVRRDQVVGLVQRLVTIGLWPVVLVHLLNRELDRSREEVCDNYALQGRSPTSYAATLLWLSETIAARRASLPLTAAMASYLPLRRRVQKLLDPRRSPSMRAPRAAVTLSLLILASAGMTLAAAGRDASPPASRAAGASQPAFTQPATTQPATTRALGRSASFDVLCVNEAGEPLANVHVYVMHFVFHSRNLWDHTPSVIGPIQTDAKGLARLTDLAQPMLGDRGFDQHIFARVSGKMIGGGFRSSFWQKEDVKPFRVRLVDAQPLKGTVVIPPGFDVKKVEITFLGFRIDAHAGQFDSGVTYTGIAQGLLPAVFEHKVDADGSFTIPEVPKAGHYYTRAVAPGLAEAQYPLNGEAGIPALESGLTLEMKREGIIEGTLLYADSGKPASGQKLLAVSFHNVGVALGHEGVVDGAGKFRIHGLAENHYLLATISQNRGPWTMPVRTNVEVKAGATTGGLDLRLEPGAIVSGKVLDVESGAPVAGAVLWAMNPSVGEDYGVDDTASDGAGEFHMRVPSGSSSVYVNAPPPGYSHVDRNLQLKVNVKPGQREAGPLELKLRALPSARKFIPGDVVMVSVEGLSGGGSNWENIRRVASDGSISLPRIGALPLKGLTSEQACERVAGSYIERKILRAPKVSIELRKHSDPEHAYADPVLKSGESIVVKISEASYYGEAWTKKLKIDDAGEIPIPHVDRLKVSGLTTNQVEQKIADALTEPDVTVNLNADELLRP